jgi:membrane protease YdiL (CAAX protease family)
MLWAVLARQHVAPDRVGLHLHQWPHNLAVGLLAGGLRVVSQIFARMLVTITKENFNNPEILRGPAYYWICCGLVGALAEELWIASSLVALQSTGRTAAFAILVTSCVFGAAHYTYRFGAIAVAIIGAVSCGLILWTGSLLPSILFHYIGNLGLFVWARGTLPRT